MMSMVEVAFNTGIAMGPPLGNLFYNIMGFQLPFVILGSLAVFFACILGLATPDLKREGDSQILGWHCIRKIFSKVG